MSSYRLSKRQRLLWLWGGISLAAALILGAAVFLGGPRQAGSGADAAGGSEITSVLRREAGAEQARFRFRDVREQAGIDFRHFPATRRSLLPEDMGPGLAWGDYDNDGDPDLFLVNFSGSILDADPVGGRHALYRNEGGGRFLDVTEQAGLAEPSYGQGAAWGDYDNDGDLDIYLTNYGPNRLYRNEGDGRFTDVTVPAGVGDPGFSSAAAWGDYDNDGHIDLYVSNYVLFEHRETDQARVSRQHGSEIPYTINPSSYSPAPNRLYRNNSDGSFTDVAEEAGVADAQGRSLGNLWLDFDNDGLLDLYVANDVSANGVYRNRGDGSFTDIGASSLAADYRGAMGLAAGDYDRDGDMDLFVTHWLAQENGLFENMVSEGLKDGQGNRRLFFMDNAEMTGLGQISLKTVAWATGFADLDNDGLLDLWVVNGNTLEMASDTTRLKPQPLYLFQQEPEQGFFEVGHQASPALERRFVGRGGAHADYDADGRMDIAVAVHGGQPLLLHNTSSGNGHWLGIRLRQQGGNTRAIGARVSVRSGGRVQTAQVGGGGSYISQHSDDLHFGLGDEAGAVEITIHWPDGSIETHSDIQPDRLLELSHNAMYKSKEGASP